MTDPSDETGTRISASLALYAARLRSSPHNLLSSRALDELEDRHLPECRAFASGLGPVPRDGAQLLDLGTGGGLPGLVVAIARPDLSVTLLDATAKKLAFVADVAEELGIDVTCVHGRAEDLATRDDLRASFDIVSARAVAPLRRLVPWGAPFLRPNGILHAIKGERWSDELREAAPTIRRLGLQVVGAPEVGSAAATTSRASVAPMVVSIARPPTGRG